MEDPNFPSIVLTNSEGQPVPVGHCEICRALVAAYDEDEHREWHLDNNIKIHEARGGIE